MTKAIDKIEKEYQLMCGPVSVSADAVCRRRLKDYYDSILDRLTHEIHPDYIKPQAPKGHTFDEDGKVISKEDQQKVSLADKKKKMLEEGKVKVEVKSELKSYEEKLLEGNSKLLQDTSGEIKKR